jgi:hypothetical protein
MGRRLWELFAAAVLAAAPSVALSALEAQGADEYRVKAAVLYNLAKFVDWPPDVFGAGTAPLHVCVLGVDPFGDALETAFAGHQIGGRGSVVRRIGDVEPGCHVLFISGSERKRMAAITDRLRGSGVLTVSEEAGFAESGGMIELFTDGDRVRFNLNIAALEEGRLRASARLREIAAKHGGGRR